MRALYDSTYKGEEETEESDAGFFILSKVIYGINSFFYSEGDKGPVQTYNEEGEINHKAIADKQAKEREERVIEHGKKR